MEIEPKPTSRSSSPILIWQIVSQLLALGSLVIWLIVAGLAFMAFDSGETTAAWTFVIAVWSYPIWPPGFAIASCNLAFSTTSSTRLRTSASPAAKVPMPCS